MINKYSQQRGEIASDPPLRSSSNDFFFTTPALTQRLDLLRHLIGSGGFLLMLTGESGSGKSTLIKQLLMRADPQWDIHSILPVAHSDARPPLAGDSADPSVKRNAPPFGEQDANSIQDILSERIPRDSDRIPLIIIDDSKALSSDDLQLLVKSSRSDREPDLRIILVCHPEDTRRIREFIVASGEETTNTVNLPSLDEEEVGDYLHLRWNQEDALAGDAPFTDRVIRSIYHASKGLPASVNRLTDQFLQNRRPNPNRGRGTRMKSARAVGNLISSTLAMRKGKLAAVAGGGIILIMILSLFITDREPQPGTETRVLSVPTPITNAPEGKPEAIIRENDEMFGTAAPFQKTPSSPSLAIPRTSTPQEATRSVSFGNFRLDSASRPPDTGAKNITTIPRQPNMAASSPATTNTRNYLAPPTATTKTLRITPSREIDHQHKNIQTPFAETNTKSHLSKGRTPTDEKTSSKSRTHAEKQKSMRISTRRSARTIAWLRRQNSNHYTIQLLGTSNKKSMRKFLGKHQLGSQVAWFETRYNDRDWFVVVYGIYPTHKAASAKIRTLPKALRNFNPWPRKVGEILAITSNG
uniref:Cell division protein DamX, binds to the septal ring, contains C-terminal SPOR domain n=1 Tax=Candidatus Kentrum sp. TC TaxID=2126339 RepID=A0A450Z1U3_9GAMM|nr:MAG: Cell division protein DamX, binds to the septal ring, contains C-terminal SPOR domain [Candidatus Kentron sp. TC]